ncbi:uncharacterized protein LOC133786059 [Humulus lupulus]|uniref:uncharacterized protein LOC133786059 n=1 Tax=Humulus lupulus TaxID=3486 RepID=UPI002B4016AC|nr:uncharacterized protein LOC133786059 [Humulus lupulus]
MALIMPTSTSFGMNLERYICLYTWLSLSLVVSNATATLKFECCICYLFIFWVVAYSCPIVLFTRQPSLSSLRSTALSAAEKRSRMNSLLPSGPKRLGGDSTIMVALSPVQAAAMAAERRLQDDIWCGSVSCDASECGESSSDKPEDLSHVKQTAGISKVHSTSSAYASNSISRKRSRESSNFSPAQPPNGHSQSNFIDLSGASPSGLNSDHDSEHNTQETTMWGCETCTLLNPPLAPICEVCGTPKPRDMSNKYKLWSCNLCTLENSVKLDKCCACSQWRYSHGPPVASQPPNLGT